MDDQTGGAKHLGPQGLGRHEARRIGREQRSAAGCLAVRGLAADDQVGLAAQGVYAVGVVLRDARREHRSGGRLRECFAARVAVDGPGLDTFLVA